MGLRVGRDGDDGDLLEARPITPENSQGARRIIPSIRLNDLLLAVKGVGYRVVFVRLQTGMLWVAF